MVGFQALTAGRSNGIFLCVWGRGGSMCASEKAGSICWPQICVCVWVGGQAGGWGALGLLGQVP